jgi:hypothetical protein
MSRTGKWSFNAEVDQGSDRPLQASLTFHPGAPLVDICEIQNDEMEGPPTLWTIVEKTENGKQKIVFQLKSGTSSTDSAGASDMSKQLMSFLQTHEFVTVVESDLEWIWDATRNGVSVGQAMITPFSEDGDAGAGGGLELCVVGTKVSATQIAAGGEGEDDDLQ